MRRMFALTLSGLLLATVGTLASRGEDAIGSGSPVQLWNRVDLYDIPFFYTENLIELTAESDAVVVGRITSVGPGRVFGEIREDLDRPKQLLTYYAELEVEVLQQFQGAQLPGRIKVEVMVPEEGSWKEFEGSRLEAESLMYLHRKTDSPDDQDYYRLTLQGAVVVEGSDGAALAPDGFASTALRELTEMSFNNAVDSVSN